MSGFRAIMTSVQYSDLLAVTLPWNRHHWDEVMVITSVADEPNVRPITDACEATLLVTDDFYRDGASFRKWLALENALDVFGRHGLLVIADADVLWPKILPQFEYRHGCLVAPLRRMLTGLTHLYKHEDGTLRIFPEERDWVSLPLHSNIAEFAGYSQIHWGDDPVLGPPPWHDTDIAHAGVSDSLYQSKWPRERKIRPPWECLHLGPAGQNWLGRSTPLLSGEVLPGSRERLARIAELWRERRRRRPGDFEAEKVRPVQR